MLSERRSSSGRFWGRILTFSLALAIAAANFDRGKDGVAPRWDEGSEAGVVDRDDNEGWEETPGCTNSGVRTPLGVDCREWAGVHGWGGGVCV